MNFVLRFYRLYEPIRIVVFKHLKLRYSFFRGINPHKSASEGFVFAGNINHHNCTSEIVWVWNER